MVQMHAALMLVSHGLVAFSSSSRALRMTEAEALATLPLVTKEGCMTLYMAVRSDRIG